MDFTIYVCTNVVNGMLYVGQTRRTLATRWSQHVCDAKRLVSTRLYRALRKYGRESFRLAVLEKVDTLDAANAAEQRWISHFKSNDPQFGYNLDGGGNARGVSPETRAKQSEAQKKRFAKPGAKENLSASMCGRSLTAEHIAKLKLVRAGHAWRLGVKNKTPHPEERRSRMAAAHTGKKHSLETRAKMSASQRARAEQKRRGSLLISNQVVETVNDG